MSYKSNGTVIFEDLGSFQTKATLSDAYGVYSNLRAGGPYGITVVSGSGLIDFTRPWQGISMTSNVNFGGTGVEAGRSTLIDMNRGTYTPTFSSSILWANGGEPTWTDGARWMISMLCIDSTLIVASAQLYTG